MSDTSSLSELANFVGRSKLNAENALERRRAVNSLTGNLGVRPSRHGVGDLLAVVLALSARTRRVVMPHVDIDVDVFAPNGQRALRLILPRHG